MLQGTFIKDSGSYFVNDEQFQLLLANFPNLIWVSGTDKSCIHFNQQWLAYTGRTLEQELADGWTEGIHQDDYKHCIDTYRSCFDIHKIFVIEFRLRRFDGQYRWMLCTATPWFTAGGKFAGYTGLVTDITERKIAEEEKVQLQLQMQQMQKMEAVGRLTAGIAHDFNNILGSIIGYTGLLLTRFTPDKQGKPAEYLREVYEAGVRAKELVAQMLAFSQSSSGEYKPYQFAPLLKEAVKLLQSTLPASVEIHTHIDDDIPAVVSDPVQLHQIIINLCLNAKEAMASRGRIDIHLHWARGIDRVCASCHGQVQGDFVELAVIDTGHGIDSDVMTRMFDPFFSTNEPGQSSGMGLSVVHGITHDHGGHIEVESASGTGSTFRLLLPVAEITSEMTIDEQIAESSWVDGKSNDQRILIIDDDKSMAGFIKELLKNRGYQVTVKTNNSSVLNTFRDDPDAFDLLVLDQTMPGMSGVELALALLSIRPELPIILCTGFSDEVDEEHAMELGIQAYLGKPFSGGALLRKMEELLQEDLLRP